MPRTYSQVYQFAVALDGIEPRIWRRIQVPANYSFWDLHVAIQDAMGWHDAHLHVFRLTNPESACDVLIGIPDDDGFLDDPKVLPGSELMIAEYFSDAYPVGTYEYDLGDGWEHTVLLEATLPRAPGTKYPRCLDGRRACPPEDCGGAPGYEELLTILANPDHEEHESMMTWLGRPYDPEQFDPSSVRFQDPKKRWTDAFAQ